MKTWYVWLSAWVLLSCSNTSLDSTVLVTGAMRDVMWQGKLEASIQLDSIADKTHLYGLGPVAGLAGEILIVDGTCYVSTVVDSQQMAVSRTFEVGAPFFVHAQADQWRQIPLPGSVHDIATLEGYLQAVADTSQPFVFRLEGTIPEADIHVVNLAPGSTVTQPAEAHQGQINYLLNDCDATIVGFFSTRHQTVFTHHDTYMHIHLITRDKAWMGHVDKLTLDPSQVMLLIPE